MQTRLTRVFAGVFVLAAFSLLGCSSTNSPPGAGGSSGGEVTSTGGVSAGGTTANATNTGGALPSGGTSASGGESQAGSVAQGGSNTGGAVTSAAGQTTVGGSVAGGSVAGGSATGGGVTGGTTSTGGASTGGAGTAGKTSTGGSTGPTGGSATAGKTSTGGTTTGGSTTGGTTGGGTGKITIWMSGDSTMSGSGCTGGGWGDQFGSCFNSNVTVQNKSVAGRSIQTWLYEKNVSSTMTNGECALTATTYSANWTAMLDASTGMKAGDWLFIEFGINDGDGTCPRHVGTTLFQTYLTTMAKAATDRGAHPIFLTSTSAVACNGSTAQANRGFGPQTKATGTADNVPVIDMTVLTAALYTSAGLCPNSNDYSSTTSKVGLFFCNDHTHFEAAGALQVAKTAAQALKDQNIPLASYLVN